MTKKEKKKRRKKKKENRLAGFSPYGGVVGLLLETHSSCSLYPSTFFLKNLYTYRAAHFGPR